MAISIDSARAEKGSENGKTDFDRYYYNSKTTNNEVVDDRPTLIPEKKTDVKEIIDPKLDKQQDGQHIKPCVEKRSKNFKTSNRVDSNFDDPFPQTESNTTTTDTTPIAVASIPNTEEPIEVLRGLRIQNYNTDMKVKEERQKYIFLEKMFNEIERKNSNR
jgi:hypothetical protein